jgi:hypothetical protein
MHQSCQLSFQTQPLTQVVLTTSPGDQAMQ